MAEETTAPTPRDQRLDDIGYSKELERGYVNDLVTDVKARMMERGNERVEGDLFQGLLLQGTVESIDPELFHGLLQCGALQPAQYFACISVGKEKAGEFLSRQQISAMSSKKPKSPALVVSRIKGVETKLLESIERLGAQALAKLTLKLRGK